ncbi:hypothetical protein CVT24_001465 [Panaeolus cyanescens]|uniref:Uncharacterized protein n=1 Tax=Panaeolus cyanescens TaxID=181874 RepID=A0A409VTA9_9AGAR|nr:hypothetical protein CVT24_001465 [Panaeolus cyanescens]
MTRPLSIQAAVGNSSPRISTGEGQCTRHPYQDHGPDSGLQVSLSIFSTTHPRVIHLFSSQYIKHAGSRVVVICTIPTGDGQLSRASFQIDDGPVIPVSHRTTPPVQWQTQFWNSGPLPFGSHLLTITNLDDDAYFRMDRIDFDPTDSNAPAAPNPPPNRPTPTPPQNNPTPTPTPSPSPNPPSGSTPPTSSSNTRASQSSISTPLASSSLTSGTTSTPNNSLSSDNPQSSGGLPPATSNSPRPDPIVITGSGSDGSTGAEKTASNSLPGIIAGVLGGVVVVLLLGIVFYCLRRRRRRLQYRQTLGDADAQMAPFVQSHGYSNSKSRNPPPWNATGTFSDTGRAISPETSGSDIYTSGEHSQFGASSVGVPATISEEPPSKAAIAELNQRLSTIDPTEAPPPAYHPTK